jgi:DNA-binding beta-propeller fold protein YncE
MGAAVTLWGAVAACGATDDGSSDRFYEPNDWDGFNTSGGGGAQDTLGPDAALPPEEELSLQTPQAARDFVFVASGTLDMVAKIDARSLVIESVPVGDSPTVVLTRPTINTAVVLNTGSDDVSVLHASLERPTSEARLPIEPGMNSMALSPTGDYVVAFFDARLAKPQDRLGSLQAVSLVRTIRDQEATASLAVSFGVREVLFDSAGARAFIVTDDFLHVIDLVAVSQDPSSHDPGRRVPLAADPSQRAIDREVTVTPDGRFAVVRSLNAAKLDVIDIATGARRALALSAPASDLDLLPDGSGALAVVRDTSELVIVSLPLALGSDEGVRVIPAEGELTVGQALLSDDGQRAVVFSTADSSARVGVLALDGSDALQVWRLGSGKAIGGAVMSGDGLWLMVKHRPEQGADPILAAEGFSVVRLPDIGAASGSAQGFYDKLFTTDAEVGLALFAAESDHLIALIPERVQALDVRLSTMSGRDVALGSPPLVLGAMPVAERVYISQRHDLGRISFFDLTSGKLQTVTGFELNSRIR